MPEIRDGAAVGLKLRHVDLGGASYVVKALFALTTCFEYSDAIEEMSEALCGYARHRC